MPISQDLDFCSVGLGLFVVVTVLINNTSLSLPNIAVRRLSTHKQPWVMLLRAEEPCTGCLHSTLPLKTFNQKHQQFAETLLPSTGRK